MIYSWQYPFIAPSGHKKYCFQDAIRVNCRKSCNMWHLFHAKEPSDCHLLYYRTLLTGLSHFHGSACVENCSKRLDVKIVAFDTLPAWRILVCQRRFTIFALNFPAGSLPNLGVSHHLGVIKHPMQGWCSLIPVCSIFPGTIFTSRYHEAVSEPWLTTWKAGTMTIRPLQLITALD